MKVVVLSVLVQLFREHGEVDRAQQSVNLCNHVFYLVTNMF